MFSIEFCDEDIILAFSRNKLNKKRILDKFFNTSIENEFTYNPYDFKSPNLIMAV